MSNGEKFEMDYFEPENFYFDVRKNCWKLYREEAEISSVFDSVEDMKKVIKSVGWAIKHLVSLEDEKKRQQAALDCIGIA